MCCPENDVLGNFRLGDLKLECGQKTLGSGKCSRPAPKTCLIGLECSPGICDCGTDGSFIIFKERSLSPRAESGSPAQMRFCVCVHVCMCVYAALF